MATAILQQPGKAAAKPRTKTNRSFLRGLLTNKKALVGMTVMVAFIVLALLAAGPVSRRPLPDHRDGVHGTGR